MAINHSVETKYASGTTDYYYVLKTNLCYVRPQIINKPLRSTTMIGTNGGFFRPDGEDAYDKKPIGGVSISWTKNGADNYNCNGGMVDTNNDKIDDTPVYYKRGTLVIYRDDGGHFKERGFVVRAKTADEILNQNPDKDIVAMIGGGDLALNATGLEFEKLIREEEFTGLDQGLTGIVYPMGVVARTGLGIKYDASTGITTAYLVVSGFTASLASLRKFFKEDLGCDAAIHLDGSGSSCMQYKNADNQLCSYSMNGGTPGRYIWNMVRVTNSN